MTNGIAIRAEGLSKRYRIGLHTHGYRTVREVIADAVRRPFQSGARRRNGSTPHARAADSDVLWALDDVSFEIGAGEVVGVVGRNGAGKSTLLKVLSRITEPSAGFADVAGRIGALLEVGTGFHPELSGRENVYLNAAILGMSRREVASKFDEIIAFAEVERFVDTAVKHYSSGMYLRLAFAVAAFLQPDILLVDEVLAVGDAAFQAKCLGKMGEVASAGRTVIFVSHNMSAITELCTRGMLLERGRLVKTGTPSECVAAYLHDVRAAEPGEPGISGIALGTIRINGANACSVATGDAFTVALALQANELRNPRMFFIVEDSIGRPIIHHRVSAQEVGAPVLDGACEVRLDVPALWLSPGVYMVYFKFLVNAAGSKGRAYSPRLALEVRGNAEPSGHAVLHPDIRWTIDMVAAAGVR
jgi:lipopolysaccharide transport system ATP-binding protein